jgi:hypothetical protein
MKVTKGARLQAKLMQGLREGRLELSITAHPLDRSDGFHGPFDRFRPKRTQLPLSPGRSRDSFFRETDEFSFPDDLSFYRGVTIGAYSHIDHLLDDLGYRLAKTPTYKGRGRFFATTAEKLKHLQELCAEAGPLAAYQRRIQSVASLFGRFEAFRNLMAHGEFGLHVTKSKQRLVGVRKFGKPKKQTFHDQSAVLSIEHISRRAARLDRLARYANHAHFELCNRLSLPSGLMEIER